jgi:anti-sigma factor RsiW
MRLLRRRDDITCRQAVELITDYLEGVLSADLRRRLETHLSHCPHCAAYIAQIRATIRASRQIEVDELSPRARRTLVQLYRQTQRS